MAKQTGTSIGTDICEMLGLKANNVRRLVLTIEVDEAVTVDVEMYADFDAERVKGLKLEHYKLVPVEYDGTIEDVRLNGVPVEEDRIIKQGRDERDIPGPDYNDPGVLGAKG